MTLSDDVSKNLALIVDTTQNCPNFCICDEENECYKTSNVSAKSYIEFYPYCEGNDCHMYVIPKQPIKSINGKAMYADMNTSFAKNNGLIRANKFSCNGCAYLLKESVLAGGLVHRTENETMSR